MTKTEKYLVAGTIGVAAATTATLFPPLAPAIKIATFAGISNVLKQ